MLTGLTSVRAQAPFAAGQTYYVNGVGNDLVAPKDTFANLSGAYTVGNPYINSTGIISALTANGIDPNTIGQMTILLVPGYTGSEPSNTGVSVGQIAYSSALRTIVLKPVQGANFTITTSVAQAANTGLFSFIGSQYFVLDGEGTPGQRNLTFNVNATGANATQRVIELVSTAASPINTVTVKNININGVATGTTVTTYAGVYIGGSNINTNSARRNANINITNCEIRKVQFGVYARGFGASARGNQDLGLIVRNNRIGGNGTFIGGAANASGIFLSNQANAVIEGNTIMNNLTTQPGFKGIELSNIASTISLDSNIYINANRIYNLGATSAGITGIRVALGNHQYALNIKIVNNTIAKLTSPGSAAVNSLQYPIGILIEDSTIKGGIDVFNNSIALTGAVLNGSSSACLATGANTYGGLRVFNNIFSNVQQNIPTSVGAYNTYAILVNRNVVANNVVAPFDSIDNNLYEVTTTGGWANIGYTALNNYTAVGEWAGFTGYDVNSIVTRPFFENDTTLVTSNGAATIYASAGRAMLAQDILGNTRPTANSSIGAYQFTQNTTNALASLVGGATYNINGVNAWPTNANPTSGSFASLSTFINHLNSFGTTGTGTINIVFTTGYASDATVPPAILPYPGMSGTRPIRLSANVPVNITIPNGASISNNSALIKLYGASSFELDGTDAKNITISLPTTANSAQAKLIAIIPTIGNSTSNNTIRNCILRGSSSTTLNNTLAGIYMGASNNPTGLASAIGGANINNYIGDNIIEAVRYGIYWRAKAGLVDQFLTIIRNTIGGNQGLSGASPTTYIGGGLANTSGIYIKGVLQGTIDSNIIKNNIPTVSGFRGIDIDGTANELGTPQNISITRNTIYNLGSTNGYAAGIRVGISDANRGIIISNNIIAKIYGTGTASPANLSSASGIAIESPVVAAGVVNIGVSLIHNTIHLSQHPVTQVNAGAYSTALYVDARAAGITSRSNIFSNTYGRTIAGTASNAAAIVVGGNQNPFIESNTNVYYTGANSNFSNNIIGIVNPNIQLPSMAELKTRYGFETSSKFGEIPFKNDTTSIMDTMFVGHIAKATVRNGSIVTDIAGKARAFEATIGALELPRSYSPLLGGATYQVNGVLAPPLDGTGTVGTFNTINNLFRYINTNGVDADQPPFYEILVNITSGYVGEGDTLISALHDYPKMSGNRQIIIRPSVGANPVISSTGATIRSQFSAAGSVLRFQGARWVTIDGSSDGIGKNLTIRLPQTPANVTYVNNALTRIIDVMGWAQPATNIEIKNCKIIGYSTPTSISTFAGIYQGGVAFNSTTTVPLNPIRERNNNNRYEGNVITGVKYGVHLRGNTAFSGSYDLGTVVKGNTIGGTSYNAGVPTDYFGGINNAAGVLAISQANLLIDSNVIRNNIPTFNLNSGIEISNAAVPFFNTDSAVTITRNTITGIKTTNSAAAYGLNVNLQWGEKKSLYIYNNMISDIAALGAVPTGANFVNNPYAILLNGSQVPAQFRDIDVNIWNNSINMGQATTLGASGISACIGVTTTTLGDINLLNNILQNKLSRASAGGNIYAIAIAAATNPFKSTDYNNYYSAGTVGNNQIGGSNLGVLAVNYSTLSAWTNFTKQDTLSMSVPAPYTSDVNLLIPTNTASPLYRAGSRVSRVNNDILASPRPGLATGIATIGAHEYIGTYSDIFGPKIYDMTKPADFCNFDGVPIEIKARIMDKSSVINDTMYYRINGGTEVAAVATNKVGLDRVYTIPAQPMNTMIAYRFSGVDGGNQSSIFVNTDPRSGYNYTTTVIAITPNRAIATGFDLPNEYNWTAEGIDGSTNIWDLQSFGSVTNPVLAPLTGSRAAMLNSANNTASRISSTCLDFSDAKRPTLRLFVSQSADNFNLNDSILVRVSYGFGMYFDLVSSYPIYRKNASFAVPGYKVYDVCLGLQGNSGIRLGIEGYSKNGGNIIIDSIVIFDNFLTLPVTPKNFTNCYNDSINLVIANADSKFEYTMFDMLTQRFIGPTVIGNDANMTLQGYLSTSDSAYLRVWARNLTSNCTNFLDDTAIVHFRNFKNGPFVIRGSVYDGQYNSGDMFTPDAIKVGGVARYEIVPPTGATNAGYNNTWTVADVTLYKYVYNQVTNTNVIVDSARNFTLVPPTPSTAGYVIVTGMPVDSNKTFTMLVKIRLLPQGCDSTVVRYVTIGNAPIANFFAPNDTLCQNINNQFTNVSTTGQFTLPMQYSWDFGDGTTSNAASPIKAYATPGNYRVRMIVKNNTTLLDSAAYNVTVLPSPVASFTSTLSCEGKVTRFTSTGAHTSGNFYSFNIGGQVADSSVVDAIVAGSDTIINVRLLVRNVEGCIDTTTNPVQVFAQPTASFTAQNVCAGAPVQFSNASSIATGKNGRINTFGSEWTFGNGDIGYSNSPLYYYPAGGSYKAVLKVISNYGCTDTISTTVSVFNKPSAAFTIDNACKGSNLIINNNSTFADGLTRVKYRWTFGDNSAPKTDATPVHAFGAIGTYFVKLVATDSVNGCVDSIQSIATVKDKAIADFTTSNGCAGKAVTFTNQSIVPPSVTPTFTYIFGDNSTSNIPNTTHSYISGGVKQPKLIVDVDGCRDTATKTITISSALSVNFVSDKLDSNKVRFTSNRTGLSRYSWNFGDGTPIVNTSSNAITHIFDRKGVYNVELTILDANSCDASYSESITINANVGLNEELAAQLKFNVYPNPFTQSTKVEFDLENSENVKLEVFDMIGRNVYTHHAGLLTAGKQNIELNETQFSAKSAVYMVRVHIGNNVITRQLIKE
jgi:PKD repeat protein